MKEAWQKAPLTSLIILIQVLVFILMTLAGGSTNSQMLVEFGARQDSCTLDSRIW